MSERQLAAYLEARDVLRRMQDASAHRQAPGRPQPASGHAPPNGR